MLKTKNHRIFSIFLRKVSEIIVVEPLKFTNMENNDLMIYDEDDLRSKIHMLRGGLVMLDRDLAALYEVETKYLKRQVKRNIERFPDDFMFQLTNEEVSILRCQFGTSRWGGDRYLPFAFTKNGVAMLSGVLNSGKAVDVNIRIMRAFTAISRMVSINTNISQRISNIEYHQIETDKRIDEVFKRLDIETPHEGLFYNGQIFDAYNFISDLIRKAKEEIILIDNYIDDSVLKILNKRGNDVTATIYTSKISDNLKLDLTKHNSQYPPIKIEILNKFHDRFLIIDDDLYHIGASFKDLGKSVFAFSKLKIDKELILSRL